MSNRNYDKPALVLGKRLVEIVGSFVPLGGAGTIDPTLVKGWGFGFAPTAGAMALKPSASPGIASTPGILRTGTGVYTLTLEDNYIDAILWESHIIRPAGTSTGGVSILTSPTNLGSGTLAPTFTLVTNSTVGTAADLGTTYRVGFRLWLRDSTVNYGKP